MTTYYHVDQQTGAIKAVFGESRKPKAGRIEIDGDTVPPPGDGRDIWDGAKWTRPASVAAEIAREVDRDFLRTEARSVVVLTELVRALLDKGVIQQADFTPAIRQVFLDLEAAANRVKA